MGSAAFDFIDAAAIRIHECFSRFFGSLALFCRIRLLGANRHVPTSVSKVFSDERNSDDWNAAAAKSRQLLFDIGNASDDAKRIWHVGATSPPPLAQRRPCNINRQEATIESWPE
jgi:hypothetical protein